MRKTIHLKGYADKVLDGLDDCYDLDVGFDFDEESSATIPNCFIRLYDCEKECSLEGALKGHLQTMFGNAELTGQEYGYSEYTIEGFTVNTFKIGEAHDLKEIMKSKEGRYIHLLIDQVSD